MLGKFATTLFSGFLITANACGVSCAQCKVSCDSQWDQCQQECQAGAADLGKCNNACGIQNNICSSKCSKLRDSDPSLRN
jgi:hypothetical protein